MRQSPLPVLGDTEQQKRAAILHRWRLANLIRGADARHREHGEILDRLLTEVVEHSDEPEIFLTHLEWAVLHGNVGQARLLWRASSYRKSLDPDWVPETTLWLYGWLAAVPEAPVLVDLAEALLSETAAQLRRAYLPVLLEHLRLHGEESSYATLAKRWFREYPQEPEAWWLVLAATLSGATTDDLATILPQANELPEPEHEWQIELLARLALTGPEPYRWLALARLTETMRRHDDRHVLSTLVPSLPAGPSARTEVVTVVHLAILAACGELDQVAALLPLLPAPESAVERLLATMLTVLVLDPRQAAPETLERVGELLDAIQRQDPRLSLLFRIVPQLDWQQICEFAIRSSSPSLTKRALSVLESTDLPPQSFLHLAERLLLVGQADVAAEVLRSAARKCWLQHDRVTLLTVLRTLARVDPTDRRALDYVVAADTRRGRHREAIDTILAVAQRAEHLGNRPLHRSLLQRARELAELVDDRARLAMIAELLAANEPDSPERRVEAATALLRADQVERARAHLWAAIRAALAQRDLDTALAAAQQLVALNPDDPAAVAQLREVRALLGRAEREPGMPPWHAQ